MRLLSVLLRLVASCELRKDVFSEPEDDSVRDVFSESPFCYDKKFQY